MKRGIQLGAVLAAALLLPACGFRAGYRSSYKDAAESGPYGGPWLAYAVSTAAKPDPTGSGFLVLQADYQFARGPDFATLGGGFAVAPGALGWHNAVTFLVGWEPWNGQGVHFSLCDGYGNWGTVTACARWSTKGYWGIDLGAGLSPTRLGADIHETCRTGCNRSGGDWD